MRAARRTEGQRNMNFPERALILNKIRKKALISITRGTAPLWHTRPTTDLGPAVKALRVEMETARSSSTAGEWSTHCADLAFCILHSDPGRFLRWPVILDTMNIIGPDYIDTEFYNLGHSGENGNLFCKSQRSALMIRIGSIPGPAPIRSIIATIWRAS
jgi:hypothetical protein